MKIELIPGVGIRVAVDVTRPDGTPGEPEAYDAARGVLMRSEVVTEGELFAAVDAVREAIKRDRVSGR